MLDSFWRFTKGVVCHGLAFFVGGVLVLLDAVERVAKWLGLDPPSVHPVIGWAILALGFLYAAWRTYHDLWLSLPKEERRKTGFLTLNDAANELPRFLNKSLLEECDYDDTGQAHRNFAQAHMEWLIEGCHIDVYRPDTLGNFRKLTPDVAKEVEPREYLIDDDLRSDLFVKRRDLGLAMRRYKAHELVKAQCCD